MGPWKKALLIGKSVTASHTQVPLTLLSSNCRGWAFCYVKSSFAEPSKLAPPKSSESGTDYVTELPPYNQRTNSSGRLIPDKARGSCYHGFPPTTLFLSDPCREVRETPPMVSIMATGYYEYAISVSQRSGPFPCFLPSNFMQSWASAIVWCWAVVFLRWRPGWEWITSIGLQINHDCVAFSVLCVTDSIRASIS